MLSLNVETLRSVVSNSAGFRIVGKLHSAQGLLTARIPASVGDMCEIEVQPGRTVLGEVIGFHRGLAQILPYADVGGVGLDSTVTALEDPLTLPFSERLLGRVINGLGQPIDRLGPIAATRHVPVARTVPEAMRRRRISTPLPTGVRVIDGLLTIGHGQRLGLFAGSGVGKSTLLGEIARGAASDLNVIALIGERGREVRPFIEDCLGEQGLKRSVVVVASSDEPPLMRVRAAQSAISIAAEFRRRGQNVLFLLDSLTRLAMAQREIGIQIGEPPSARGFPPSTFQLLATLLEQLGTSEHGAITGILTVLVDGDDMDEPVSDAARSMLDGHVVLSRKLAEKGHFPAVDVSRSISRLFHDVTDPKQQQSARKLRALMATYDEVADLIRLGAYTKGSSPQVDRAISLMPALRSFLIQRAGQHEPFDKTNSAMKDIANAWEFS